jgi:hypothetical protein
MPNLKGMNVEALMNLRTQVDKRLVELRAELEKQLGRSRDGNNLWNIGDDRYLALANDRGIFGGRQPVTNRIHSDYSAVVTALEVETTIQGPFPDYPSKSLSVELCSSR